MTAAEAASKDMLHSPIAQPQNNRHQEHTSTRLHCSVVAAELISVTVKSLSGATAVRLPALC